MGLRSPLVGAVILMLGLLMPRLAEAGPIAGGQLFATGGEVTVTFLGQSAQFTNHLHLFSASDLSTPLQSDIFINTTAIVGQTVSLGSFAAGTELVFAIQVEQSGMLFFTGPGSRNQDGLAHAAVDDGLPPEFPGYGGLPAGALAVGFEDIFGGGDFDYNDLAFAFSNLRSGAPMGISNLSAPIETTVTPVPEPATLLLLGSGLTGGLYRRLRRKNSSA